MLTLRKDFVKNSQRTKTDMLLIRSITQNICYTNPSKAKNEMGGTTLHTLHFAYDQVIFENDRHSIVHGSDIAQWISGMEPNQSTEGRQ